MNSYKLISVVNDKIQLHNWVLDSLKSSLNEDERSKHVAIMAIIGAPGSGKSFYTNLLMKYLENQSCNWLSQPPSTLNNENVLLGFQFGDVKNLQNEKAVEAETGIYIWNKPYVVKNFYGCTNIWILHFHCKRGENEKDIYSILNSTLCHLCSRITVIKWRNELTDSATKNPEMYHSTEVNNSLHFTDVIYLQIEKPLELQFESSRIKSQQDSPTTSSRRPGRGNGINIVYINESSDRLHSNSGKLILSADIHHQIENAIMAIANVQKIKQKLDQNGKNLTTCDMKTYFEYCVGQLNSQKSTPGRLPVIDSQTMVPCKFQFKAENLGNTTEHHLRCLHSKPDTPPSKTDECTVSLPTKALERVSNPNLAKTFLSWLKSLGKDRDAKQTNIELSLLGSNATANERHEEKNTVSQITKKSCKLYKTVETTLQIQNNTIQHENQFNDKTPDRYAHHDVTNRHEQLDIKKRYAQQELSKIQSRQGLPMLRTQQETPNIQPNREIPMMQTQQSILQIQPHQEIPMIHTKQEITNMESHQQLPKIQLRQEKPIIKTQQEIPKIQLHQEKPMIQPQQDTPIIQARQEILMIQTQQEIPIIQSHQGQPMMQTQKCIPTMHPSQEIPILPTVQETPKTQPRQEIPMLKTQQEIPIIQSHKGLPMIQTEHETPKMQRRHAITLIQPHQEIPKLQTQQNIPKRNSLDGLKNTPGLEETPNRQAQEEISNKHRMQEILSRLTNQNVKCMQIQQREESYTPPEMPMIAPLPTLDTAVSKNKDKIVASQGKKEKVTFKVEDNNIKRFLDLAHQIFPLKIEKRLDDWIANMTASSILSVENIYNDCFDETMNFREKFCISKNSELKLRQQLNDKCLPYKQDIQRIIDNILAYHQWFSKQVRRDVWYPESKFAKDLESFQTIKDENNKVTHYMLKAIKEMTNIYAGIFKSIQRYENEIAAIVCSKILNVYCKEMALNFSNLNHNSQNLLAFHSFLKNLCGSNLKQVLVNTKYQEQSSNPLSQKMVEDLYTRIEQDYKVQRRTKRDLLETMHSYIVDELSNHKTLYISEMKKILKPEGISVEKFREQHEKIMNDTVKEFTQKINIFVGKEKHFASYLKVIQSNIDSAWDGFESQNLAFLKKTMEKNSLCENAFISSAGPENETKSPIIFQLTLSKLGTNFYLNGNLETLEYCPTVVGITTQNVFLCGNDVLCKTNTTKFERTYFLENQLQLDQTSSKPEILEIDNNEYEVKNELLLGFLLHTQKMHLVEKFNFNTNACIILIPFWMTSQQRQTIKDSGIIAGFSKVHVLNENTAGAIQIIHSKRYETADRVIIFSENSNHVDITIYEHKKQANSLIMTGQYGTYLVNGYWYADDDDADKIIKAYNTAQTMADENQTSAPNQIAIGILSRSNYWEGILVNTGQKILGKDCMPDMLSPISISGAFLCDSETPRKSIYEWHISKICRCIVRHQSRVTDSDKKFFSKTNSLPLEDSFQISQEIVDFYQYNTSGAKSLITTMQFKSFTQRQPVHVKLHVSAESIVTCSITSENFASSVSWNHSCLEEKMMQDFKALIKSIHRKGTMLAACETKRQKLLVLGNDLLAKLTTKNDNFRSELAQSNANIQIKEAVGLLFLPNITATDVEAQQELLKFYESKLSGKKPSFS